MKEDQQTTYSPNAIENTHDGAERVENAANYFQQRDSGLSIRDLNDQINNII